MTSKMFKKVFPTLISFFIFFTTAVFKRPFVEDFMKFCFERFEVGIWSSAKE